MVKMNEKLIVLLILGLLVHQHPVNCFISMILDVVSFAWSAFQVLNEVHDTYNKFTTPSTADIMEKTEEIAESLDKWGSRIEVKIEQSTDKILTRIPLQGQIGADVNILNTHVGRIDELYADLKEYLEHPDWFNNQSLTNLVKTFTERGGDDVQGVTSAIYNLIIPKKLGQMQLKESLFLLLAQQTREYGLELCNTGAPPQQRLVQFFDVVIQAELKGLTMTGFGLLMNGYLNTLNASGDMQRFQHKFMLRAKEYLLILKNTMSVAARQFRRCDPPGGQKQDVTSYEFVTFLTAYLAQEGVLTEENSCKEDCEGYTQPTQVHVGCRGLQCGEAHCAGRIVNCKSMNYYAEICSWRGKRKRRYEFFKDGNDVLYGSDVDGCKENLVYGGKREDYDGNSCDVCRCICADDGPLSDWSNHFISLRDQIADINDNMVVVGISFVMIKRIAHLKIQQGKLGPAGEISENSTIWLEPEDIQLNRGKTVETHWTDKWEHFFLKNTIDGEQEELITEKDVAVLKWEERRINLDTLSLPENHVLTGVRFRRKTEEDTKPIQLEIHGTRFDDKTGQLDLDSSIWVTPDEMQYSKKYTRKDRVEYEGEGFKNPWKSVSTKIDTKPHSFIDMYWSSLQYDAGQTTIPLLDALPVTSQPSTPLVGVGIYHKKQPGYGGFLTLVLEGMNLAPYVPTDF